MRDIKDTYKHLEEHTGDPEFRDALVQDHDVPLFLNVDNAYQFNSWTWRSAAQLYICFDNVRDIPDKDYWAVRKFLAPYENLLRLAKVGEIKAAKTQDMPTSVREDDLMGISGVFNDLRAKTQLTDVVLATGLEEDRERFPAHRVFLASRSEYFRGLFCGSFGESSSTSGPVIVDCGDDCLRATLG